MLRDTLSGLQNEELLVHITAPDEDRLEMAAERVRALLVPVDDDKNLHKQQQARNHETVALELVILIAFRATVRARC